MARFKQIMYFAVIIVVFAIFTNYMIGVGLKNTYKTISGEIKSASPEIIISDAKTTDVNGYVNGVIKNNSENDIDTIFIKVNFYSKRNVHLGTEYIEVSDLKLGESREFELKYNYNKVNHYEIDCVKEK